VLILADFAMSESTPSQADDPCELVAEGTKKCLSITANRAASAWYSLLPNPVVAESILDHIVNVAHHLHTDGKSAGPTGVQVHRDPRPKPRSTENPRRRVILASSRVFPHDRRGAWATGTCLIKGLCMSSIVSA